MQGCCGRGGETVGGVMVAGLEVTARCLVFVCQAEGGGAAGLLQVQASLGVLSWRAWSAG
jgi:hypothetical protein